MGKRTKEIVEEVKKLEQERYGIELDIETPTIIEYYHDNIKRGEFSFKHNTPYSFISKVLGAKNYGLAYKDKAIIFDKNRFSEFRMPIKYLGLPLEDIHITNTIYHEIAHLLQFKNMLGPYGLFCSNILSDIYGDIKYYISIKQHDGYYHEMSANLYGWANTRKHFEGNEKALEYIDKYIGQYGTQKYTYNFDEKLEKYQTLFESNGEKYYDFQLDIWNKDGTFKTPREIINDEKFNMRKNDFGFMEFYSRVLSSKSYLSRLDIGKLNTDEINFVMTAIDNNNAFLNRDSAKIEEYYAHQMIDKNTYENAIKKLDARISEKNEFKIFISRYKENGAIENKKNDSVMPTLEYGRDLILEKEKPRKVKTKSESKSVLKEIIDTFNNISIKWLTLYAEVIAVPLMFLEGGPSNPIAAVSVAATGIAAAGIAAAGIAASKLPNYKKSDKSR